PRAPDRSAAGPWHARPDARARSRCCPGPPRAAPDSAPTPRNRAPGSCASCRGGRAPRGCARRARANRPPRPAPPRAGPCLPPRPAPPSPSRHPICTIMLAYRLNCTICSAGLERPVQRGDLRSVEQRLTILVGTMTGTAQLVADEVADVIKARGIDVKVVPMDGLDAAIFTDGAFLVCSSTYGQGDVPDNAQALFADLERTRPDLGRVRYGVIGLGDR